MFDVLTIGTATRDVFLLSPAFKVLRDPKHLESIGFPTGEAQCFALGAKIDVGEPIFTIGGGATNAAVTFSRQGFKAATLIKIGNDERGNMVVASLKQDKVNVLAPRDSLHGTAYSTILLTSGGERTVLVYRGASENLAERDAPLKKLTSKWVYFVPGRIQFGFIETLVHHFKKIGASVAMNPSRYYLGLGDKFRKLMKRLDVIVVNREEASYLTGIDYKNERAVFKKFDDLTPGIAVVTDGSRGARVSDGKYIYSAGIFKEKKLIDRTGAGDAFGSGFVAGLIHKNDIHHALRVAAANATSVVESIGAQSGILRERDLGSSRWKYLDLDIEPL
ncbi:carbohydrate kinase family protein [Candidatus Jorgensenbacteria bacterium]|nr:carbohydrate kinase family protein [Candidatus Jorgensenbacteria bacterium]